MSDKILRQMARKKRNLLSPEILAVLRSSPNLEPCEKFRHNPDVEEFFAHISHDKCEQCSDFFDELIRESKMIAMLRQGRNYGNKMKIPT